MKQETDEKASTGNVFQAVLLAILAIIGVYLIWDWFSDLSEIGELMVGAGCLYLSRPGFWNKTMPSDDKQSSILAVYLAVFGVQGIGFLWIWSIGNTNDFFLFFGIMLCVVSALGFRNVLRSKSDRKDQQNPDE